MMQNKSERKTKLEQQRLLLIQRIERINKRKDELTLLNILLDAEKEELMFKSKVVEGLMNRRKEEVVFSKHTVTGSFKIMPLSLILCMN